MIYTNAEAYWELRQTTKTDIFEKIAKSFQHFKGYFRQKWSGSNTYYKIIV